MINVPASHIAASILCDKAYDTSLSDIWSVAETDALIHEKDDHVQIAFRGTEFKNSWPKKWSWEALSNTRDVIRDLRAWPSFGGLGYWGHKGFKVSAERWVGMYSLRLSAIGKPLKLYGHSLGGGISPHAAYSFVARGLEVVEVVTFGEPAGFYFNSEEKYQDLNIPTFSYLNENDWIRAAPPWGETAVPRTHINHKPGFSTQAHNIKHYTKSLEDLIN